MLATAGVVVGVTVTRAREHATATRKRAEEARRRELGLRKRPVSTQAVDDEEQDGRPVGTRAVTLIVPSAAFTFTFPAPDCICEGVRSGRRLGGRVHSPRLTVIGLDAATFDVIDPMIEAGELPNLAEIFESGSRGVLRSTTHPLTTQAWTTMLTGVNAGRHGMWDFCERDETGYRLRMVNGSYRRAPAVWDHLTAAGRSVGIVNVPFTWPAPEVNGFLIAGVDAASRERGLTYPDTLLADLRRRYDKLEFDHELPLDRDGYIDVERMGAAIRAESRRQPLAGGALRARPAVRRLHGGRPHAALRLAGVGRTGNGEPGGRGLPPSRRGSRCDS